MTKSENNFYTPKFSHIYVEKKVKDHPITKKILSRFPHAKFIEIDQYQEVFHRPKQNFFLQKNTQKLILAEKKDNYFYPGAEVCHDFGNSHFYYTTNILNCIYNCDYCYLQGMFSSANVVLFVNIEDYFAELDKMLELHPVYLPISYDTDLLAFENIAPFTSQWIEYAKKHPNLTIEIRTKSVNYPAIRHFEPLENVILGWTVSPDDIVKRYERGTPALEARLKAIKQTIDDGWKVRLSFDPLLHIDHWREHYQECVDQTFTILPADKILDISVGVFRMPKDYLKNIRKYRNDSDLIYYPYENIEGVYTYSQEIREKLIQEVTRMIEKYVPKEKIYM
ncbi:SPL family radical SAM protein [Tepidibacillus sp. LV47]|uniref:SPL family radical SAM protein n=1 Tax=Tepidibacillus sp. LV47 TaxID=3398228 RepID=UPI003AAD00FC